MSESQKELFKEIMKEIRDNRQKILDDWCKAYVADLYEIGVDISPSMFVLCESDFHEEQGMMIKNYYCRTKRHFEKEEWFKKEDAPQDEKVLCYNKNEDYPTVGGMRLEAGVFPGYSIDYGWRVGVTRWTYLPIEPEVDDEETQDQ